MPGRSMTPLDLPQAAVPVAHARPDSPADELRFLLHAAVLALSDSYVPPWRFQIEGNRAALYVDFARTWRETDPSGREMTLACGAALSYLEAVAQRQGRGIAITPYPDPTRPELLAQVWLEPAAVGGPDVAPPPSAGRERLVWATGAGPKPGDVALRALEAVVVRSAAWLHLEQRPDRRAALVALIAESDDQHTRDPVRRRAGTADSGPACWRRPAQPPAGRLEPFVIHPAGGRRAGRPEQGAAGHPLFAVLGTAGDSRHDWLHAGQALGRLLMQARRQRILPAFRNQLIRVPALRTRLGELIEREGFPQLVLALLPDTPAPAAQG